MKPAIAKLLKAQEADQKNYKIPDNQRVGERVITRLRYVGQLPIAREQETRIYLQGCSAWSGAAHRAFEAGEAPCSVCQNRDLKPREYCLGCDRAGSDGKVTYTGVPVEKDSATKYRKGKLAGGRG